MRRRPPLGFTLTELLVVLLILAALTALVLPVLVPARRRSHEAVCFSNLRQLYLAVSAYRHDHDGVEPAEGLSVTCEALGTPCAGESYLHLLRHYAGPKPARVCPAYPAPVSENCECTYEPFLMIRPGVRDDYAEGVTRRVFAHLGARTPMFRCLEHNPPFVPNVTPLDTPYKVLSVRYDRQARTETFPFEKLTVEALLPPGGR